MKNISISILFVLALSFSGQAQNVSLFAGSPNVPGYNSSGTAISSAKFNQPYGIALDGQGNFWISETGGQVIYMITSSNMVYVRAGSYTNTGYVNSSGVNARFYNPKGMAVGPNNEIYIADYSNNVIRKLTAFTSLGSAQTVSKFSGKQGTSGGYVNGSATVAEFNGPTDIVVDASGNLYVSDFNNHVIRKITSSGAVSLLAGQPNSSGSTDGHATSTAKFNGPAGLYLKDSVLYVTDNWGSKIRKISLNSSWVKTISSAYWTPSDILEYDGSLYFTDQHRVARYSNSTLTTYAGSATLNQSGYTNGFGTAARFYNAKGMIYNPADTSMLIIDSDNHVIRKVTLCPTITPNITISGNTSFCDGDSVILTGPSGYASYTWSNSKTTQSIVVKNSATLTLTVTNSNQCTGISSPVTLTKKSLPNANFNMDSTACIGIDEAITYTGSAGSGATYTWDFDGGSISSGSGQGPYNVGWNSTGSKQITLQVSENGCSSTVNTKYINVYAIPTSTFTIKNALCAFEHDTITFTGQASTSATFSWDFNGATVVSGSGRGPYILYWVNSATKTVKLTVVDHFCNSTQTSNQLNIQAVPNAAFTSKTTMCFGDIDTISFTGSAGSSAVYNWDFDGGNILSGSGAGPYTVDWNTVGSKTISLIITENGCNSAPSNVSLQVNQLPTSTFDIKNTACTFTNDTITYTGNATSGASYLWNFDGATVLSGSGQGPYILHWQLAGTKMVTLKVSANGCESNIKIEQVLVTESPTAAFAMPTSICEEQQTTVTFIGIAGTTAVYNWDFDGATIVSGSGSGPYIVKWTGFGTKAPSLYIEENGCVSNVYSLSITVNQKPTAVFTVNSEVCLDRNISVDYVGNASSSANYVWNFGDAVQQSGSGQGPYIISWNSAGAKQISLQVSEGGCSSGNFTKDITVNPNPPVPTITQNGNTLTSSSATNNQWFDLSGIINGANTQDYNPPADGTYYVVVTDSKGCSAQSADFDFIHIGLSEYELTDFLIYPNPVHDVLIIESGKHALSDVVISIIASDGKIVLSRKLENKIHEIDLSHIEKGLYILRLSSNEEIRNLKLLKN
ncbi:MAG: T9SS type A sorting domain-containing protein [Bacteroidetes bacterium]|nr:T9SS type A sorting domain-containing protein [Bacteroidota bacterium]